MALKMASPVFWCQSGRFETGKGCFLDAFRLAPSTGQVVPIVFALIISVLADGGARF